MKSQSNARNEIRQFYQDTKDEFNAKLPTVTLLERLADKALYLAEEWKGKSNRDVTGLHFIIHKMKIFRSDVSGELQHDYDSETKRYTGLWKTQERIIKGLVDEFLALYDKVETRKSEKTD